MLANEAEHYIPLVIERLKPLNLDKVILFGSFAYGEPCEGSDLDLLVVIGSEFFPQTHQEKEKIYLEVARALRDIRGKIALDLIVHTRPMHEKFIELNSQFAREVTEKGQVLYESRNP